MNMVASLIRRLLHRESASEPAPDDRFELLEALRRQHALISVEVPRLERAFQTVILQLEADAGILLVDELFPAQGRDELLPGDMLEVVARGDRSLHFYSRLLERRPTLQAPIYVLELPDDIGAVHRRHSYRVYVGAERTLAIELSDPQGALLAAELVNLSVDGVKLSLPAETQSWALEHYLFDSARLVLPGGYVVDTTIELLNRYPLRAPRPQLLAGGRLHIAQPTQRARLEQYLAALQRRQRRRAAGLG